MLSIQNAFEPGHVDWLSEAYDEAQRRYSGSRGLCDPITAEVIAHRIMDLAREGEADFEAIVTRSLWGVDLAAH